MDNKPPPIGCIHPFYLTQRFFFCVCIVAPHLRLFHVQLSKLLVGALQDSAERTLTDPGAHVPTDTVGRIFACHLGPDGKYMYIRIYILYYIYILICLLYILYIYYIYIHNYIIIYIYMCVCVLALWSHHAMHMFSVIPILLSFLDLQCIPVIFS